MLWPDKKLKRGFTLVELAIVLAVAGLLFAGLWRLLASGNQQVRDQSTASQQQQLIAAVKEFLASSQGQTFMGGLSPNGTSALALPTSNKSIANCTASIPANISGFCNFLPAGFAGGAAATPNPYGQAYVIRVLKDNSAVGTPPNTYSFLIVTVGGDIIPDTSGGRISAFIGGDGGFIYNTAVCGTPAALMACGSYGTWSANVTAYGFPAINMSGHIATRTYISPTASGIFPWLSRSLMSGDAPHAPIWNTMQTDLVLGSNSGTGMSNNFWLGSVTQTPTGGGVINVQNGIINMAVPGATSGGGMINLQGGIINDWPDAYNSGRIVMTANGPLHTNSFVSLSTNCTSDLAGPNIAQLGGTDPSCVAGLQVTGDANVAGQMQVWNFYSQTFIYKGSDVRLKTNIQPLTNSLTDVMQLKPVSYTLKSNGKPSLGVIAQDVEKIYPQLVSENGGMKAVEYEALIAPLIGAVQELKKENDQLRQELDIEKTQRKKFEDDLRRKEAP